MNNFQINQVKRILQEYNPEYDVPDGPRIPWYTELLASAVLKQHTEIEKLADMVDALREALVLQIEFNRQVHKDLTGENKNEDR